MTDLAVHDLRQPPGTYARVANDWYVESKESVIALLNAERFRGMIYDPACGGGNIPFVCRSLGHEAFGSDLMDRGFGRTGLDFLTETAISEPDNVITNPPFSLAQRFIERGLEIARRKVAVLVRLAFLEGQARKPFFERSPLARVLVFSYRVSMPPGGSGMKAEGGKVAYCWLVFDQMHRGAPEVGWL